MPVARRRGLAPRGLAVNVLDNHDAPSSHKISDGEVTSILTLGVVDTNVPVIALLIPVEIAAGGCGDIFPLAVQARSTPAGFVTHTVAEPCFPRVTVRVPRVCSG